MTSEEFKFWMQCMHLSERRAADVLGVSPATVGDWVRGRSRTTGKIVVIDKRTALACSAIHKGLDPWPNVGQDE